MDHIQLIDHNGDWHALFDTINPLSDTPVQKHVPLGLKAVEIYRKKATRKAKQYFKNHMEPKSHCIEVASIRPPKNPAKKKTFRIVPTKGYWYIHFSYKGEDGGTIRYRKTSGLKATEENKHEAHCIGRLRYHKLAKPKAQSLDFSQGCDLVKELIEKYMAILKNRDLKPSTLKGYNSINRHHLLPVFGTMPISSLNTELIETWFTTITGVSKKAISAKTKNNILNFFSEILSKAADWGYLAKNPAKTVKRCKVIPKEKKIWTQPQRDQFLTTIKEECTETHAIFATSLFTGVRVGELLALSWEDIDWERNLLHIRNNFVEKEITTPKNRTSRWVNISPHLAKILQKHRQKSMKSTGLLFSRSNGEHLSNSMLRTPFLKYQKKAKVPKIRMHDMRHTFASLALMSGADLASVQKWLGHKHVQTTMGYISLIPEHLRDQIKKIDPVVQSPKPMNFGILSVITSMNKPQSYGAIAAI